MKIIDWANCPSEEQSRYLKRNNNVEDVSTIVREIIEQVKIGGDTAIARYTQQFDNVAPVFAVAEKEWESASKLDKRYQQAISIAYENIYCLHELEKPQTLTTNQNGIQIDRIYRAIESVGLYIPGGTAPLVSTVLMLAIPAQIAGCKNIIMITPPNGNGLIHPAILYAANLCGVNLVYGFGGAQGIAALAYGSESVPKVNKIFGPGNKYVMEAKRQVANDPNGAAMDMPAGPSEVMIIADETANVNFVASDLLAQAEHDEAAKCVLVTPYHAIAEKVLIEIERQQRLLKRQSQLTQSLRSGLILLAPNLADCFTLANQYAPEHLILHLKNPRSYLDKIRSAGSVFLGPWSAEACGDYASGPNHVLPTSGFAKTYSGLSVKDFMTAISIQEVSAEGFRSLAPFIETLAELETLDGHQQSITLRRKYLEEKAA